ncbi:MAG: SemiSWEET family transporter [Rickettsiales bacterium]
MPEGDFFISFMGWLATILASVCFLPQAYKVCKERSAKGLSLATFSLLCLTNLSWMIYGFMLGDKPLVVTNVSAFCVNGLILAFAIKDKLDASKPVFSSNGRELLSDPVNTDSFA